MDVKAMICGFIGRALKPVLFKVHDVRIVEDHGWYDAWIGSELWCSSGSYESAEWFAICACMSQYRLVQAFLA